MIDELTSDRPLSDGRQEQLIKEYCHGIDERIRRSASKEEAERIVQDACSGFDQACESNLVRSFLKRYVNDLFARSWSRSS
jgi:hypothetical protein